MYIDIDEDGPVDLGIHTVRKADSTRPGMTADAIREGVKIGTSRVVRAVNGTSTFPGRGLRPARLVTFANGKSAAYELGTVVAVKRGYAEPLPAGGVQSGTVRTPAKVRAHSGDWRGESDTGGRRVFDHDLIAVSNMFDQGRVNGSTQSARGMGSVPQTGKNF